MEVMKRLDWHKVGALTEDGQKYSDYISDMQVSLADILYFIVCLQRESSKFPSVLRTEILILRLEFKVAR